MPLQLREVFSDSRIQAAIDEAAAKIPAKDNSAIVAHVDGDGASLSLIVRKGDHWTIEGACVKPWHGPLEYGADVIYSWK